jgi:rhodanese-related sulfurtransferase
MQLLKNYITIIAIAGIIIILVLLRTFSTGHFENNAKMHAQPSFGNSILITEKQISSLGQDILFIVLDKNDFPENHHPEKSISVPVDSILEKRTLKTIFRHKGPVMLCSSDPAVSSQIWMILSQMGRRNIFILTDDPDNELFKNKFRPDTLNKPE